MTSSEVTSIYMHWNSICYSVRWITSCVASYLKPCNHAISRHDYYTYSWAEKGTLPHSGKQKIWLITREETDVYKKWERRQIRRRVTHSRKRVMYWRLHRDQLGGDVPYRSWGDMTNGLFPIGSQLLPLPSCSIPKLKHRAKDDDMTEQGIK